MSRIALSSVSIIACLAIAACGGRTENLRSDVVASDEAQVIGDRQSLMRCTNGAGESIGDSVFELTVDGRVYRDGVLKTDQLVSKRDNDAYTYEISWFSLIGGNTSRYDYVHHENEWLYDPTIAGEAFLATEQRGSENQNDVITYFEEGVSGESIQRCGVSTMTDRNFLSCRESGSNSGPTIAKRKLARYNPETNLLSIDNVARDLRPRNDPVTNETLSDLDDGWQRYERRTSQPSFHGTEELVTRQTMEFNPATGLVRNFESRNSPTAYSVSCR